MKLFKWFTSNKKRKKKRLPAIDRDRYIGNWGAESFRRTKEYFDSHPEILEFLAKISKKENPE